MIHAQKLLLNQPMCFGVCFMAFILNIARLIYARNVVCWELNLVPYLIKPGFSVYQQDYIKHQIGKINNQTCLYWSDVSESEALQSHASLVKFKKSWNDTCETTVFFHRVQMRLLWVEVLLGDLCFKEKAVLHELVHALGFSHENKRIDRDCYVWVSENAKRYNRFKIDRVTHIPNIDKFPYDKESVMHEPRSTNLKALSERFYEWEALGNDGEHLTDLDLWKIQYRFCGRPHYCEVYPQHCRDMERIEFEKNCA